MNGLQFLVLTALVGVIFFFTWYTVLGVFIGIVFLLMFLLSIMYLYEFFVPNE